MKFDFVVSRIEKSQEGIPFVYVTLANPNDLKASTGKIPPECPFDPNQTTITSPEDLMKNLPDAMANIGKVMDGGGFSTDSPTLTAEKYGERKNLNSSFAARRGIGSCISTQ